MKDYSKSLLEETRPQKNAIECINFCLQALYRDKKHVVTDEVVAGLTFEELIGALLLARDRARAAEEYELEEEEEEEN